MIGRRGMELLAEGYSEDEVLRILEQDQIEALEKDAKLVDQAMQTSLAQFKQMTQELVDMLKTVSTQHDVRRQQIELLRERVKFVQTGVGNLQQGIQTATQELTEAQAKYQHVREELRAAQAKAVTTGMTPGLIPPGGPFHLMRRK